VVVVGKFRQKSELRTKRRQTLRYAAKIVMDENGTTQSCLISDISESGARLITKEAGELPDQFILLLSSTGEVRRTCSLVWREGKVTGVRFAEPSSDAWEQKNNASRTTTNN
jgi:hypothetical protein